MLEKKDVLCNTLQIEGDDTIYALLVTFQPQVDWLHDRGLNFLPEPLLSHVSRMNPSNYVSSLQIR